MQFTDTEKAILAAAQVDLPDTPTPFADIAARVGTTEDEVLALLSRLKAEGVIRRFGATLRHQKAGYSHNAMVAWYVEDDHDIDAVGAHMAARSEISHCYHRENCMDWPYNLYTMIHGTEPGEVQALAAELSRQTGVAQYDVLQSVAELKKKSMIYFATDEEPK